MPVEDNCTPSLSRENGLPLLPSCAQVMKQVFSAPSCRKYELNASTMNRGTSYQVQNSIKHRISKSWHLKWNNRFVKDIKRNYGPTSGWNGTTAGSRNTLSVTILRPHKTTPVQGSPLRNHYQIKRPMPNMRQIGAQDQTVFLQDPKSAVR